MSKTLDDPYKKNFATTLYLGALVIVFIVSIFGTSLMETDKRGQFNNRNNSIIIGSSSALFFSTILILITIPYTIKNDKDSENKILSSINKILLYPLTSILTILLILGFAFQIIYFKERLVKNLVADEYNSWHKTFMFLLLLQMILLAYDNIMNNKTNNKTNNSFKYIIYLISIFNIIGLGIMQTILQFFSTDG